MDKHQVIHGGLEGAQVTVIDDCEKTISYKIVAYVLQLCDAQVKFRG